MAKKTGITKLGKVVLFLSFISILFIIFVFTYTFYDPDLRSSFLLFLKIFLPAAFIIYLISYFIHVQKIKKNH
jgi:phosphatidylglycerophosphate synthase